MNDFIFNQEDPIHKNVLALCTEAGNPNSFAETKLWMDVYSNVERIALPIPCNHDGLTTTTTKSNNFKSV